MERKLFFVFLLISSICQLEWLYFFIVFFIFKFLVNLYIMA